MRAHRTVASRDEVGADTGSGSHDHMTHSAHQHVELRIATGEESRRVYVAALLCGLRASLTLVLGVTDARATRARVWADADDVLVAVGGEDDLALIALSR